MACHAYVILNNEKIVCEKKYRHDVHAALVRTDWRYEDTKILWRG